MRKKERGGRGKGKGGEVGKRDGRESLRGKGGQRKRGGKRGGKGKFRGPAPQCYFLEPRLHSLSFLDAKRHKRYLRLIFFYAVIVIRRQAELVHMTLHVIFLTVIRSMEGY